MSRFHDEFFKQRGTKHDNLLIRCLSDENLRKIAVAPEWPTFPLQSVGWKCRNIFNNDVVYAWTFQYGESDASFEKITQNGVPVVPKFQRSEEIDYQTEVICKNGSFIIGYADLLISCKRNAEATTELEGTPLCLVKNNELFTLVEVKPELEDVGAVIRQLKTYESILRRDCQVSKCIVCGNQVPPHIQKLLAHEGIKVVVFEEPK